MNRQILSSDCFQSAVTKIKAEWHPEAVPPTILYAELAAHFAANFDSIGDDEKKDIFSIIETNLIQENEPDSTFELTGFVESLLHKDSNGQFDFSKILKLLGERTREYCIKYNSFTSNSIKGLDS